jgi:hypothetical protein
MASLSKTARSLAVGLILGLACESSDGSVEQSAVCATYVECASALAPDTQMAIEEAYGPEGTCWSSQSNADACTNTCEEQLAMLAQDNPGQAECQGGSADGTSTG